MLVTHAAEALCQDMLENVWNRGPRGEKQRRESSSTP